MNRRNALAAVLVTFCGFVLLLFFSILRNTFLQCATFSSVTINEQIVEQKKCDSPIFSLQTLLSDVRRFDAAFLHDPHLHLIDLCPNPSLFGLSTLALMHRRRVIVVSPHWDHLSRLRSTVHAANISDNRLQTLWGRLPYPAASNILSNDQPGPYIKLADLRVSAVFPGAQVMVRLCLDQLDALLLRDELWQSKLVSMVVVEDRSEEGSGEVAMELRRRVYFDTGPVMTSYGFQAFSSFDGSALRLTQSNTFRWPATVFWKRLTS